MPALVRDFEIIAVDQRGIGLSDKPEEGYDTGTLANDLAAMMEALGHQRFAVVGVDTGMLIGYALAADHPDGSYVWQSARLRCRASRRRTR
jgi:pimeloyl-ACP methyl ester carboxylesterase